MLFLNALLLGTNAEILPKNMFKKTASPTPDKHVSRASSSSFDEEAVMQLIDSPQKYSEL